MWLCSASESSLELSNMESRAKIFKSAEEAFTELQRFDPVKRSDVLFKLGGKVD